MKYFAPFLFSVVAVINGYSQTTDEEKRKILAEGSKLYQSEMASWYGTDIFMGKFADKRSKARGYLSYFENGKVTCVFFSDEPKKIVASFTFDSTYNVNTAIVDGEERDLTSLESALVEIRSVALREYRTDTTLFKSYQHMNPNFIPLADELGKRVYVLTGPEENGVVVFGNDYLLTFDKENILVEKKRIHSSLIAIRHGNANSEKIVTMTKDAWDKIAKDQESRKKEKQN